MPVAIPLAIAGAGIAGAGAQIFGAQTAANAQMAAANKASQTQMDMFNQGKDLVMPWVQRGNVAGNQLMNLTGLGPGGDPMTSYLTAPFNPTQQQLESVPGYKFQLDQALKASQNGFAAKGLASSGAAMQGAAGVANGLASSNWQAYSQNDLAQRQAMFNMLSGQSAQGAGAAGSVFGGGNQVAQGVANNITGAGNAQAAGNIATGNAVAGALNGGINSYMQYNLLQNMMANNAWAAPPGLNGAYAGNAAAAFGV